MSTEGFDISSLNSLLFSHIIISLNTEHLENSP